MGEGVYAPRAGHGEWTSWGEERGADGRAGNEPWLVHSTSWRKKLGS
jgi:hypothetical protein